MITTELLQQVITRYQQTQPGGIKLVDEQLAIFSPDCVFISFPVASVVGSTEARVLRGHKAMREAFVNYNEFIRGYESVLMTYADAYTQVSNDARTGICGFTLKIHTTKKAPEQGLDQHSYALNHLQLQVDESGLVIKSLNWQASVASDVHALV